MVIFMYINVRYGHENDRRPRRASGRSARVVKQHTYAAICHHSPVPCPHELDNVMHMLHQVPIRPYSRTQCKYTTPKKIVFYGTGAHVPATAVTHFAYSAGCLAIGACST